MVEWLSKSHLNLRASITHKTIKNANIIQTTNYKYKSMYYSGGQPNTVNYFEDF